MTRTGACFCGSVEVEVSGDPVAMGYCHCSSCRAWSAAPVTAFSLWPPGDVRITRGGEHVGSSPGPRRASGTSVPAAAVT